MWRLQTSPLDGFYDETNGTFVLQGNYVLESIEIEPGASRARERMLEKLRVPSAKALRCARFREVLE